MDDRERRKNRMLDSINWLYWSIMATIHLATLTLITAKLGGYITCSWRFTLMPVLVWWFGAFFALTIIAAVTSLVANPLTSVKKNKKFKQPYS